MARTKQTHRRTVAGTGLTPRQELMALANRKNAMERPRGRTARMKVSRPSHIKTIRTNPVVMNSPAEISAFLQGHRYTTKAFKEECVNFDSDEEDNVYDIEEVKNCRLLENGQWEYYVKWMGYDASHDSWEPEECFSVDPQALVDFWNEELRIGHHHHKEKRKQMRELGLQCQKPGHGEDYFKEQIQRAQARWEQRKRKKIVLEEEEDAAEAETQVDEEEEEVEKKSGEPSSVEYTENQDSAVRLKKRKVTEEVVDLTDGKGQDLTEVMLKESSKVTSQSPGRPVPHVYTDPSTGVVYKLSSDLMNRENTLRTYLKICVEGFVEEEKLTDQELWMVETQGRAIYTFAREMVLKLMCLSEASVEDRYLYGSSQQPAAKSEYWLEFPLSQDYNEYGYPEAGVDPSSDRPMAWWIAVLMEKSQGNKRMPCAFISWYDNRVVIKLYAKKKEIVLPRCHSVIHKADLW